MSDKLRNFLVRTASGAVLLAVVLGAAFAGVWGYGALLLLITVVGVWEFYNLAKAKGVQPQRCVGIITSLMILAVGYHELLTIVESRGHSAVAFTMIDAKPFIIGAMLLFALIFVVEVFRAKENPTLNIATTIMGVIYVALPMSLMLVVPTMLTSEAWNPMVFLCYLFLVWGNDVFAYLFGITLGRHKMCPRLSPKKSWEGFFGGVAGSLAMGALGAYVTEGSYIVWIGLALVVSLSSVVGDLVESMFKRDAGVKDSGAFIPGHGGMLDRFDALILSAPFAFVYLSILSFLNYM